MRVLHVFKDYFPPTHGGVEQHIHDVTHGIEGIQFAVLTSSRSKARIVSNDDGVQVIRTPERFRPASTPITPSWSKVLRESGADAFHFHMPNPFGEMSYLASRAQGPMIASYHADIVGRGAVLPLFKPFQQLFLKRAAAIVVGNPRLLETSAALEKHVERCRIIPYGVDAADWVKRPDKADKIRENHPGPLIVFLGRLAYYKGIEVLIDAMRSVEATCLIVGEGPLRSDCEALVSEWRLRHKVIFVGDVSDDDRAAYYHAADIFVLPSTSRAESFGIVMLEAMACGTPAISTELGTGTSWLNQNNITGMVVPPGDSAMLAGAIEAMLGDPGRREAMGHAAAQRVREQFAKSSMLDSLSELYRDVLSVGRYS